MKSPADMILSEVGDVEQIVRVACTIETARRGEPVNPSDTGVQTLAADLILGGLGAEMRRILEERQRP
jgi:hypothetical protein